MEWKLRNTIRVTNKNKKNIIRILVLIIRIRIIVITLIYTHSIRISLFFLSYSIVMLRTSQLGEGGEENEKSKNSKECLHGGY